MGKVAKIVPPEKLAIAEENGIPAVTVYKRLNRGWDLEEAIAKPTQKAYKQRERGSLGQFADAGKGHTWRFTMPQEWDDKLRAAIAESGMSEYDYIAQIVINKLKRMK